jgi:hypothetical protein
LLRGRLPVVPLALDTCPARCEQCAPFPQFVERQHLSGVGIDEALNLLLDRCFLPLQIAPTRQTCVALQSRLPGVL